MVPEINWQVADYTDCIDMMITGKDFIEPVEQQYWDEVSKDFYVTNKYHMPGELAQPSMEVREFLHEQGIEYFIWDMYTNAIKLSFLHLTEEQEIALKLRFK